MANKKINELSTISGVASGDMLVVYDVSDITTEKTKSILYSDFESGLSTTPSKIEQGNSFVDVTDVGAGNITMSADGTEIFDMTSNNMVLGVSGDTNIQMNQSSGQTAVLSNNTTVANFNQTIQRIGVYTDTVLEVNQASDYIFGYVNDNLMIAATSSSVQVGENNKSRVIVDSGGGTVSIYAGPTEVVDLSSTVQTFGVANDTYLKLDQGDNLIEFTGTFSGTGDIHCADLYTSGNTIYVGDRLTIESDPYTEIISSLGSLSLQCVPHNEAAGTVSLEVYSTSTSGLEPFLSGNSGATTIYYEGDRLFQAAQNRLELHRPDDQDKYIEFSLTSQGTYQVTNYTPGQGIVLRAENVAETTNHSMFVGDPDSSVDLYYNGTKTMSTTTGGLRVDNANGAGFLIQSGNDTVLQNYIADGLVYIYGRDSVPSSPVIFKADPNGAAELYHNGARTLSTRPTGAMVYHSSSPTLALTNSTGTSQGYVWVDISNKITHVTNQLTSGDVRLSGKDALGSVKSVSWAPQGGGLYPEQNDAFDCGTSGNKWDDIWATTGSIQTSDERAKTSISGSDLGLDFINDLNPVSYMFKDYDWEYEYTTNSGNTVTVSGSKTYNRTHYGLIAQEVKATLSGINKSTEEFAGYVYDEGADIFAIRYHEFMAPMMKAIQQLSDKMDDLTTRIEALEP